MQGVGWGGEGKVEADERKDTDRFRREREREVAAREESREGSEKGKQRQGTQQVLPARLPPWLRVPSQGEGRHSCCHDGQRAERPSNQYVTARHNRTCLSRVRLRFPVFL